jgi:hypothetical protein
MSKRDICFATFARNEKVRLPVWLKHYQQFADNEDIYIIDQNTTDGSTDNLPCNIIYEPNELVFDHKWLREMLTKNIKLLLEKYHIVVINECDELLITKNNIELSNYLISKYKNLNVNICTNMINIVQHDDEPDFDINEKISKQRRYMVGEGNGLKHIIYTHCKIQVENGFHDGDGIYDNNLVSVHIHLLDKQWFIDKIHNRIKEKNIYGAGDNHGCWTVHYKIEIIDENLKYYYDNLQTVYDYFSNNRYI